MSSLYIIQAGTPPDDIKALHGDLPAWFCKVLGRSEDAVDVVPVFQGAELPSPRAEDAAIITGSWAMVTDRLQWSELTAQWIRDAMAVNMSLFGVCYGHQLMAHALGGTVDYHPKGREVGCHQIELLPGSESDPLLHSFPKTFFAHLTHEQSVISAPAGATVLGRSAHDAHQIIRYGVRAISTQFHPEFTPELSAACIQRRVDLLRHEGKAPDLLLAALREAPAPATLIRNFVASAGSSSRNNQ